MPAVPRLLRIYFTGMVISFLGSLPLGTLNVAAMQISITDGVRAALLFSTGCLFVEVVYVRLSLIAMDWVRKQEKVFRVLEWITLAIITALAFASFYSAVHPSVHKNIILNSNLNKFILGVIMSAVNPVQIPFWFGWSTVLFTKKILLPQSSHYNVYIAGIGTGTLFGNFVFVFGGQLIAGKINAHQNVMSWIIGVIFTITALIQLWRMLNKKDAQHQLAHPEEQAHEFQDKWDRMDKTH
jgi:threonine/homoserine/homoserine lactone efflux protein